MKPLFVLSIPPKDNLYKEVYQKNINEDKGAPRAVNSLFADRNATFDKINDI